MNLLLFQTPSGELFPVVPRAAEDQPQHSVDAGWLDRWKAQIRRGYFKLAERFNHEELTCAHLRHAQGLAVRHSARQPSEAVEKKFRQFLNMRYSKHGRWFWIDAVLAFFGIFLMFLPGPNVFFFYPAIRSLGHYHARNGAKNVLSLESFSYHPEPLIDEVQEKLHDLDATTGAVEQLEKRYGFENLKKLLTQLGKHES